MKLKQLLTHPAEWIRNLTKEILSRNVSKEFEWNAWASDKRSSGFPVFFIRVNEKIFHIMTNEYQMWRIEQVSESTLLDQTHKRWLTPAQVIDWIEERIRK